MNYFSPSTAAERYAKGRPDFHRNTIKHIKNFLCPAHKLATALDVACGTGLSTKALLDIAVTIYGSDLSQEMLKFTPSDEQINYVQASAEQQPFADSMFDLITVSSAVHWFNIERFLTETNRLLKGDGWLVLYENYFGSEMVGNNDFKNWYRNIYLKKYPSPPRNNSYDWSDENLNLKHFKFVTEERFKNVIKFSKKQLALYFTTQSNIISAVENGETNYDEADRWLADELAVFFEEDTTTQMVVYGNWIKFIQRKT